MRGTRWGSSSRVANDLLQGNLVIPAHPFDRIPEGRLRWFVLPVSGLGFLLLVVIVEMVHRAPGWIVFGELVLSFSSAGAAEALSGWSAEDRVHIAFINGLDYLFGPLYANLLALASVWAGRTGEGRRQMGSFFAWLSWVVLALDIPENVAYLNLVLGHVNQPWPLVSASCILARTLLVLAVLAFIARGVMKRRPLDPRSP